MKVSELTGAKLDYWVAKALGRWDANHEFRVTLDSHTVLIAPAISCDDNSEDFSPSTLWAHGGPIMDEHRIASFFDSGYGAWFWVAGMDLRAEEGRYWGDQTGAEPAFLKLDNSQLGETRLIASMRALVASKYGDEVPDAD